MISLQNIDLMLIDCLDSEKAIETLKICTAKIKFGNVFFVTDKKTKTDFTKVSISSIKTIEQYSDFCLKLNKYTNNDFLLIVQNDGFILNPELWDNLFLSFDYIGAPWKHTYVTGQKVGNGGFSLRSKRFLNFASKFDTTNGVPEDNFLCLDKYHDAINFGIKFADVHLASKFAYEHYNDYATSFNPKNHFGFHGKLNLPKVNDFILKRGKLPLIT